MNDLPPSTFSQSLEKLATEGGEFKISVNGDQPILAVRFTPSQKPVDVRDLVFQIGEWRGVLSLKIERVAQ